MTIPPLRGGSSTLRSTICTTRFLMLGMTAAARAPQHARSRRARRSCSTATTTWTAPPRSSSSRRPSSWPAGAAEYHIPHRLQRRLRHAAGSDRGGGGGRRRADRQRGYGHPRGRGGAPRARARHRRHRHRPPPARAPNCRPRSPCSIRTSRTAPTRRRTSAARAWRSSWCRRCWATLDWPADKLRRITESFLKLVAIGTVADVVPLTGENRVIVKHGLDGLRSVRNPGLRALL